MVNFIQHNILGIVVVAVVNADEELSEVAGTYLAIAGMLTFIAFMLMFGLLTFARKQLYS